MIDRTPFDRDAGLTIEHDSKEKRMERRGWPDLSRIVGLALSAVIGFGAIFGIGGGANRADAGGFGHGFAGRHIDRVLDRIGASDEQSAEIRKIFERARAELMPEGYGLRQDRRELTSLLAASTVDPSVIEKLRSERLGALEAASKKAVSSLIEAAQVLTPEQRTELAARMDRRGW